MIRIGIISTARINKNSIINPSQTLDGIQIIKLFSRNKKKAIKYSSYFNIKNYIIGYNNEKSYKNIDLVYISLPNSFHFEMCKKMLLLKKHVICEKPLCFTYSEAKELIDIAKRNNCFLAEGFHYKYHPTNKEIIKNIMNGNFGKIKYIKLNIENSLPSHEDIRLNKKLKGGCLAHIGSYIFDFIGTLYEFTQMKSICIHGTKYMNEIDIEIKASLKMKNKVVIDIYSTFLSQNLKSALYIETDQGYFNFDNFFTPNSQDTYACNELINSYYFQLKKFTSNIKNFDFSPKINLNGMMFFELFYKMIY